LGDAAVQVLDFANHYVWPVGVFAGVEFVLVVLFGEECVSVFGL
jgi:hypothetical protein